MDNHLWTNYMDQFIYIYIVWSISYMDMLSNMDILSNMDTCRCTVGVWEVGFGVRGGGVTCVTSFDLFLSYLAICCNNRAFLTTEPPRWNDLFYNYSYLTSRPASMVELSCAGDMLMKRVNENSLFTSEIRQGYKINTLEVYTPNI